MPTQSHCLQHLHTQTALAREMGHNMPLSNWNQNIPRRTWKFIVNAVPGCGSKNFFFLFT